MIRIAIAGGPGTGKTTLSRYLVTELLNNRRLNTQAVNEYARDYINRCRSTQAWYTNRLSDQLYIFERQLERENEIPETVQFVVTDSPLFLFPVYALPLVKTFQDREIYCGLYRKWIELRYRYDYTFLLNREEPILSDGTRGEDDAQATAIDTRVRAILELHQLPFIELSGSHEERLQKVLDTLSADSVI